MAEAMCSCSAESVCSRCAARYARQLGDVPALLAELEVSAARLGRAGLLARGSSKGKSAPLPFDPAASDLAREIATTITEGVLLMLDDLGLFMHRARGERFDVAGAVGLLLSKRQATSPAAVAWLDEVSVRARQMILGRQRDRWFAGVCGADVVRFEVVDGVLTPFLLRCEARLFASTHAPAVRCPDCEASWSVESRRVQLVLYAEEFELPLRLIVGALPWLAGVGVKPETWRKWTHARLDRRRTFVVSPGGVVRKTRLRRPAQLVARSVDVDGVELFRVGDVIDLAVEAARRSVARLRVVVDTTRLEA